MSPLAIPLAGQVGKHVQIFLTEIEHWLHNFDRSLFRTLKTLGGSPGRKGLREYRQELPINLITGRFPPIIDTPLLCVYCPGLTWQHLLSQTVICFHLQA